MIQLISTRPTSGSTSYDTNRLSDPELLLWLAERFRSGNIDPELDRVFSLVLHDLRMGGTWKRTNRGRLPCAEQMICRNLQAHTAGRVAVLDLGASDGTTTLDLASALRRSFGDVVHVYLTDLNLWLLRYRKGFFVEYRAANGEAIMARIGRLGLRLSERRWGDRQEADPIAKLYLLCTGLRRSMRREASISLVHPLVARDPSIEVMELNCLSREPALTNRIAAIRASNVLNCGYFTSAQLQTALANMHAYLLEDGCIVISRNEVTSNGESENGSVWRKVGNRFIHVSDFGKGSEIKQVVDNWIQI